LRWTSQRSKSLPAAAALADWSFFDSALESGEALSIVAAAPVEVLQGNLNRDFAMLRDSIAARQVEAGVDRGLPGGFAAGWVEYDGSFCFGIYEHALIFRHGDATWHEVGELWSKVDGGRPNIESSVTCPVFSTAMTREEFCGRVARAQDYIAAGHIYQVNITHRFSASWAGGRICVLREPS
jgi:hypothetical protein